MSIFEPTKWATTVPTLLRADGRPDTVAHHVLLVAATFADADGTNVRPSIATLTKRSHLTSERTTAAALRRLEEAKLIIRAGELTGGTVVWRLNYEISGELDSVLEDRRERARLKNAERQQRFREKHRNALPERYADPASNALPERDVTPCQGVSNALPERESRSDERYNRRSSQLHQPLDQPMTGQGDLFPPTAGAAAPCDDVPGTQQIVATWIDRCPKRPPSNVIGQISKHVKAMLAEGIDPNDVQQGLTEWARKPLHPSTLPSVVNEVMNRPTASAGRANGYQPYRNPTDQSAYDEGI